MGVDSQKFDAFAGKFFRLARLAQSLESKPRDFGTGEMFSGSEIHMIESIGRSSNLSVTNIAEMLAVTKGAVSQTLKRLVSRGLVEKKQDPANLSRCNVELTASGRKIFEAHRKWHETLDGGFLRFFENLNDREADFLQKLLDRLEDFFVKRLRLEE